MIKKGILLAGERGTRLYKAIQNPQGLMVACPEEIAFRSGWIGPENLERAAKLFSGSDYGKYLYSLLEPREHSIDKTPLLSVVMPTYSTPAELLKEAIDSVKRQRYPTGSLVSRTTPRRNPTSTPFWTAARRTTRGSRCVIA